MKGQNMQEQAVGQIAKQSALDRLKWRLFPQLLMPEKENDERTYVSTRIEVHVDWLDRIRLLVSGKAVVYVTTYTDVLVNEAEAVSNFAVLP